MRSQQAGTWNGVVDTQQEVRTSGRLGILGGEYALKTIKEGEIS